MAQTIIAGDESTDLVNSVQHRLDVSDTIAEEEPNNAPYMAFLRRMRKTEATATQVQWLEDSTYPNFDVVSASGTSAATAIPATNAAYFRVGDFVRVTETMEGMQVTGVSASGIGVNRGIGSKTAASFTSAAGLYIVNNANAEGASLRTIKSVKLTNASNYTQIIRDPWGVTKTEIAVLEYGQYANEYDRRMHLTGLAHERKLEFTSLFGAKKEDLGTAGAPVRFAGGLIEYISTNVVASVGTLTRSVFETNMRAAFRYGSDRKIAILSPLAASAIDGWAWNSAASGNGNGVRANFSADSPLKSLGVAVNSYTSSQGIIDFVMVKHWLDDANLKGYMFIVDPANVEYAPLRTRDTHTLEDLQEPSADKREGEYLTECTFRIKLERTHMLATGITG